MKQGIHPKYEENATITCSCGAVHETGSSKGNLTVEICSQCHPFYTGKKKMVDSTGRVDRFKKMAEKTSIKKEVVIKAKVAKKTKTEKAEKKPADKKAKKKATK